MDDRGSSHRERSGDPESQAADSRTGEVSVSPAETTTAETSEVDSPTAVSPTEATADSRMLTDFVWVLGSGLIFGTVLAGPAWWLAGEAGLMGLAGSAVLCLIPGCLAVLLRRVIADSGTFFLAANGLRLAFVLPGALVGRLFVDGDGLKEFFVWLILFYLFTLAVETALAYRRDVSSGRP